LTSGGQLDVGEPLLRWLLQLLLKLLDILACLKGR